MLRVGSKYVSLIPYFKYIRFEVNLKLGSGWDKDLINVIILIEYLMQVISVCMEDCYVQLIQSTLF